MDFYGGLRQSMIDTMQISIKQIRMVLGLGVQELADIIGLSRQSINNIETGKSKISTAQFIALCAVIDHFCKENKELVTVITSILNANDTTNERRIFDSFSGQFLLEKWFSSFPGNSRVVLNGTSLIEDLTNNYRIFLDDTALCEITDSGEFSSLLTGLQDQGRTFVVPLKAVEMLQTKVLDDDANSLAVAKQGIRHLKLLQQMGISEIRGDQGDISLLTTLLSVFIKYKTVYRLALITQNNALANSILKLNHDDVGGFPVLVLRCTPQNTLEKWNEKDKMDEIGAQVTNTSETPEMIVDELITDTILHEALSSSTQTPEWNNQKSEPVDVTPTDTMFPGWDTI